jgi:5'(3')-deoxyribonucleotidase
MSKKLLALDGDQVLFDYASGFIGFAIKQGYGLNINSKFDTHNMSKWFTQMLEHEFTSLIRQYNRSEHPPVYGYLRDLLPKLQKKYDIVVISSYSDDEVANTRRKNVLLGLDLNNVFLLGMQESKQEILEEIKPDIFVDDSPKHLQEGLDAGIERVIAIEYPYNKGLDKVEYIETLEELL